MTCLHVQDNAKSDFVKNREENIRQKDLMLLSAGFVSIKYGVFNLGFQQHLILLSVY